MEDRPLLITAQIQLVDQNMAFASLDSKLKDSMFLNEHQRLAMGREVKEDDFLYFAFKLCHVGKNNNKDIFLHEELVKPYEKRKGVVVPSWRTPEGEPMDYDHNLGFPAIVGDIYQSVYVEKPAPDDDERPYIKCAALIYRGLYPDVAFKVARGAKLGYAKVSMEVRFKQGVPTHEGRVLRGLNFRGAALTRFPADEDALLDTETTPAKADEAPSTRQIAVGSTMVTVPVRRAA